MINIIIADDHTMFRQGLVNLLHSVQHITILAECNNGTEALQQILNLKPDVAVLDISMPGMTGTEIVQQLAAEKNATRILLLTMHDDPDMCDRTFAVGASGFVLKGDAFDELVNAIQEVAAGNRAISHSLRQFYSDSSALRPAPLSKREIQILTMIANGCTNRVIASELNISIKTVESHRENIIGKLDVHSAVEMTRYAIKVGLI